MSFIPKTSSLSSNIGKSLDRLLRVDLIGEQRALGFAVPSAGALYPYEFDLVFDTRRGKRRFSGLQLAELRDVLDEGHPEDSVSLTLSLAFRPDISRAKYGNRGLIYGMQDCGHVLANLTLAAEALGLDHDLTLHRQDWGTAAEWPLAAPVFDITLSAMLLHDPENTPTQWLDVMGRRRSADAFSACPVQPEQLARLLDMARQVGSAQPFPFALHTVRRDVAGHWMMHAGAPTPAGVGPYALTGLKPTDLFCGQAFTETSAAVVFLSAFRGDPGRVLHQSLAAGQAGQCLYLATQMVGLGGCCVGGFDYAEAARILALADNRYVAYAFLLGHEGLRLPRVDRQSRPSPRDAIVDFPVARSFDSGKVTLHPRT
jgi:nitroreductase